MKPCLGGEDSKGKAYGECGWQPVRKVWYTELTGTARIRACVLKDWHVPPLLTAEAVKHFLAKGFLHSKGAGTPNDEKAAKHEKERGKRLLKDGDIVTIEKQTGEDVVVGKGKEVNGKTGTLWLSALSPAQLKGLSEKTLAGSSTVAPASVATLARGSAKVGHDLAARFRVHVGFENQQEQKGKKVFRFELLPHTYWSFGAKCDQSAKTVTKRGCGKIFLDVPTMGGMYVEEPTPGEKL
jgi:hypothetical protein